MAKTEETIKLEKEIYQETTSKIGVFGCLEVTIGFGGNERVDYLTYDTKGIWRCYEVKVSKEDFHSKAHHTFVGNFNYYVIPYKLFKELENEIPKGIGVYCGCSLYRRAKRQNLGADEKILKESMIRSLYREYDKFLKTNDSDYINRLRNKITRLEARARESENGRIQYSNAIYMICGKYNLDYEEVRNLIRNH